jgi:hypothetical protein
MIATPELGGSASGGCGAFVSADRAGTVREVFPEGCDNPGLEEPLRQALLKWKLNQLVVNGTPVHVQSMIYVEGATCVLCGRQCQPRHG